MEFFTNFPEGSIFGTRNYDVIKDDRGGFTIEVDLPGLSQDDVDVTVERDTLTIRAEKVTERRKTSFSKAFNIEVFDKKSIKAIVANGVLSVSLNLSKSSKPRKIKVESA